jgi:hypothetical protein
VDESSVRFFLIVFVRKKSQKHELLFLVKQKNME